MKKITLTLIAFLAGAATLLAVDDNWLKDLDEAKKVAKEENKHIMLEFTGSDWCPPCIKLKEDVLTTSDFKSFAKENLVLVYLDFPRRKELSAEQTSHNQKAAQKYKIQAFPTVILLDSDGEVVGKTMGYPRGGKSGFMEFLKENTAS